MTHYFCRQCDEFFTEEKGMPNINKVHKCGSLARIVKHDSSEDK